MEFADYPMDEVCMVATIQVKALKVQRSKRIILDIPKLMIDARPALLLGANGAGKSTLFSVLASESSQRDGVIRRKGSISVVEQSFKPIIGFTSAEYCAYVAWLFGQDRKLAKKQSLDWLDFVDLSRVAGQRCESLSGGERSRLAIATALNSGAQTLLLDEPSAALDPLNKEHMTEVYQRIVDKGHNLVVSTHDAGELQKPFERVIVLDKGKLYFDGSRQDFVQLASESENSPAHILSRSFVRRGPDIGA
ncbi:ATP-binding cassette domain-containing protein [Corynebacterium auriscanis]|uniref:ATP-binding cassette domain-containing protein n=1 Tax=Corynebacterium auriscanis TaxID=99807 RepID=UPI0022466503|nr:ATP-binding cassette domain-containing protein [Corynebacterium auriscanis]MCX2162617.1 ATP-binding cassette domain-containing protein [Corynebacterium auriscanis]